MDTLETRLNLARILHKHERPVKQYPNGVGILTADFNDLISDIIDYLNKDTPACDNFHSDPFVNDYICLNCGKMLSNHKK